MSRIISRAEAFERAYEAFQQINFNAFDFNTVKQSLLDYMKLYFPEDFNNFIESDELIAILELFAYIAEQFAYRLDINAHENFITQAQRKESVLRLAKLISYSASRNIPARGLVKLTSVTTTENVIDSNGTNISNFKVNWNDTVNANWKEQFILIMNRVLRQEFGSISPTERVQVDDVLFELYELNNNPIANGVFSYNTNVSGENIQLELVPTELTDNGPQERRPNNQALFSFLYGSDGLGDGSDTTGFFMYTKQGSLTNEQAVFDGVTPNQTYEINVDDINDTDVWINNIDPDTGETLDDGTVPDGVSGEWSEVDLANAQNIIFNTNTRRQKYEIETLDGDQIRLIFGDSEFADIPSGVFDVWYRTSSDTDVVVPQNTVVDTTASFTYNDSIGNVQTITFTFSLISSLQNSSPSEDIDHIRRVAPSVYFTQDRMVNDRDYNVFMLQDPSILKLRALNRTFAGDSKYLHWHDPSETYENVKMFGNDGALYIEESTGQSSVDTAIVDDLIDSYIEPIISTTDFFTILTTRGVQLSQLRKRFTTTERADLYSKLDDIVNNISPAPLNIYYDLLSNTFDFQVGGGAFAGGSPSDPVMTSTDPVIEVEFTAPTSWIVNWKRERIVLESQGMRFWNVNNYPTIDYDTLNSVDDTITILNCNLNDGWGTTVPAVLSQNWVFRILNQELNVQELRDIHKLNILPEDTDDDNIPNDMDLTDIIDGDLVYTYVVGEIELPFPILWDDLNGSIITVDGDSSGVLTLDTDYELLDASGGTTRVSGQAGNVINVISAAGGNSQVILRNRDFVYSQRESITDDWVVLDSTISNIESWFAEASPTYYPSDDPTGDYRRLRGRVGFNFAWMHSAARFNLIDPAQTNIIDMFIITRGYNISVQDWLAGETTVEPTPPTTLDLRTSYAPLLDSKMISDTVVLHPGLIKLLIGSKAIPELQATIKIIRPATARLTDNQVKTDIVSTVQTFFDINLWEYGETFYFSELAATIHAALKSEIDSVVLVPSAANHQFGDLYQVLAREDEIFQVDIGVEDIEIVQSFTALNLKQDI